MATLVWTADLFISKLEQLRTAGSKSNPALHKPLLLLLLLSRMENRTLTENVVPYGDIEEELHDLLRDFGWKSTSYHPEYPFHHLASQGFWSYELEGVKPVGRPPAGLLLQHRAAGHLDPDLFDLLSTDRTARARAISFLLTRYWPPTLHEDLKSRLALDDLETAPGPVPDQRPGRSPQFSIEVLRAYEQACAFCGFQAFFQKASFGLDAAHVRWHTEEGPDTVDNGLALCKLHHWAFDRGAVGVTPDYRVQVSQDLVGTRELGAMLLDLSGKPVRMPMKGHPAPAEAHVRWHQEHVFRGPARAI